MRKHGLVLMAGLLAAGAVGMPTAWGQTMPRKPPVTVTGKPPAVILTHKDDKLTVKTLTFRLRHDRRLDGSRIKVTASGPRVALNGTVDNAYQRRIALQLAQSTQGVTQVIDRLQLSTAKPTPAQLADAVRRALSGDPATKNAGIAVTGYRSVVTLRATVPNLYVKRVALRLAHAVPHVAVVQDHLKVPGGAVDDALVAKVQAALAGDAALKGRTFHVLAKGSFVYLRGSVYSAAEKTRAADAASRVPGVQGLSNSVTVLPAHLAP